MLDRGALLRRIAAAEQLVEHLLRVVFHGQRRCRRREGNRLAEAASIGAVALPAAAFDFGGDLNRRQGAVLSDMLGGHLVNGRPAQGRLGLSRRNASKPSARRDGVDRRALGGPVMQVADDRHIFPKRLERLQNRLEVEIGAGLVGRPGIHFGAEARVVHDRAVGKVEEAHPRLGRGGGLAQGGGRGNHGAQEGQGDRHARAAKDRAPGNMLFGDVHFEFSCRASLLVTASYFPKRVSIAPSRLPGSARHPSYHSAPAPSGTARSSRFP